MRLYVKVSSKDKLVLNKFSKFFGKLKTLPTTIKYFSKQRKKKVITILKSPHVNKTAQEQFEFRFYTKEFLVHSLKPLTAIIILKRIKDFGFPGIKLKAKSLFQSDPVKHRKFLKVLDPDMVVLNKNNLFSFQKNCIQLFDSYGETYLKDLSLLNRKSLIVSLAQLERATAF